MQTWTLAPPEPAASPCNADTERWHVVSPERAEAVAIDGNPLSAHGIGLPASISTPALIVRSGRIEPESDDPTDHMDAARRTWAGEGRARFDTVWADLSAQAAARSVEFWLHPVAGDVLGDIPAIRGLATGSPAAAVFLEPSALITRSMAEKAEDHFVRMLDPLVGTALGSGQGIVRAVAITNIAGNDLERTRVPIDDGDIDPGLLRAFAERFAALGPVCVLPQDAGVLA